MSQQLFCKICASEATFAFNGNCGGQSYTFPYYYRCRPATLKIGARQLRK